MAGSNFSKKMCQELLLYEDYLLSCKPTLLNKEKIAVDRDQLMGIIVQLRSYHCASRDFDGENEDGQMMDLRTILDVPAEASSHQQVQVSIEEATIAAQQIIEDAQHKAQQILDDVNLQAQFILDEAKRKAEELNQQALERAKQKALEVDGVLAEKINEAKRQAKAIVDKAADSAAADLEAKERQAFDLEYAAFLKADNIIEQLEKIYARQLEVIANDRAEIVDIINSIQKRR